MARRSKKGKATAPASAGTPDAKIKPAGTPSRKRPGGDDGGDAKRRKSSGGPQNNPQPLPGADAVPYEPVDIVAGAHVAACDIRNGGMWYVE